MKKGFWGRLIAVLVLTICCSCGRATPATVDIFAPDGAPALALAYAFLENDREEVRYRVVNASTIPAFVSNKEEEKNADVCVLPVNLAGKLLGSGEEYQLCGVVTHGNLFLLGDGEKITKDSAYLLKGKTIGVAQLANVPGLVAKAALSKLGLEYALLSDGGEISNEKVNLKAVEPTKDLALIGVDYLVAGSPTAEGLGLPFAGSLQELYGGEGGYPQAVVVIKKELVRFKKEWVDGFLENLALGGQWLKTAGAQEVYSAYQSMLDKELKPSFTKENLTVQAIENAGVYFTSAVESRAEILQFLEDMTKVGGGQFSVSDAFFYGV